ncbi:MAG: histidine acid phosphatase, partial [Bacteroidales bacterium]|nr:histidine acid phosphatase [Bacteroidales bacterium]
PDLQWSLVGYSKSYLPFLNPYTGECPGNLEIDQILRDKRGEWYGKYKDYCLSKIDTDAFLSRLFKNPECVKTLYEPLDLEFRFWLLASLTQCLDIQVPFWDLFTPEETLAWYTCEAYKSYMQKGPHPVNQGRGWGLGSRVFRDIINTSDKEISAGRNGVNLRFGHDAVIMSLLTVMQVNDWDSQTNSPEEAAQLWKMWNIPMASNIQLIFYRSGKNPEILVKVMLNEKVCKLPLNSSFGFYYKWSDIFKYYSDRCDYIEKNYLTNYKL